MQLLLRDLLSQERLSNVPQIMPVTDPVSKEGNTGSPGTCASNSSVFKPWMNRATWSLHTSVPLTSVFLRLVHGPLASEVLIPGMPLYKADPELPTTSESLAVTQEHAFCYML